jgi:peptidoglycan/xylan/chitin deacetylase (PgdA/CDA1 family)
MKTDFKKQIFGYWLIVMGCVAIPCKGYSQSKGVPEEIPVLCYHNIKKQASKVTAYTISADNFEKHIKILADQGYKSVLPEEVLAQLTGKKILPSKSVMISFDDTRWEHYHIARPVLEKYGFRGTFFIMTVSIGKPGYMTSAEIKKLYDDGHAVELHTYDHQDMRKLESKDWNIQVDKAKQTIQKITGKSPEFLAYPFGVWNENVIHEVKLRGLKGAFQLSGKRHAIYQDYTIRRLLVSGTWSADKMMKEVGATFRK